MKYLLFLLLIPMTIAYDFQDTVYLKETQIPFSSTISINITLAQNYTVFFNQTETSPYVTLQFSPSINFSSDLEPLNIFYNISSLNISENTTINTSIRITNNLNNVSKLYGLGFVIEKIPTISFNSTFFFDLVSNQFIINISSDLLPKEGTLPFAVKVPINSTITFSICDDWLKCPSPITSITENVSFEVGYLIPFNTSVGSYQKSFSIVAGNISKQAFITFQISSPQITLKRFFFDYPPDCYDENGVQTIKCINEQIKAEQEFLTKQREEALRLRFLKENLTVYKNVTIEKLVMVGSVDNEIKDLYYNAKSSAEDNQEKLKRANELITELQTSTQLLRNNLDSNSIMYHNTIKEMNESFINITQQQSNSSINTILIILGSVALLLIIGIGIKVWEKYNHKEAFPKW